VGRGYAASWSGARDRRHASRTVRVSQDPCLARDWLAIARGIVGLLDGDTDRLDCPTIEGEIRALAETAGFSLTLRDPR
jgi:hypothetical protein